MSYRYSQPSNEHDFELFCLRLLRELWKCPTLQQYGKRGERQDGIDLIDEGGTPPLRAVQCKHHEPDKTIPPKEIEDEVVKALGSGFALGEYYVLTTARKTAQSQKAVVRLNQEHLAKGRFRVMLWTWTEVEGHLSAMDEGVRDYVLYGDTGRSAPVLSGMLTGLLNAHFDREMYSTESALNAKLDAAKSAADKHAHEVAEHALDRIESRYSAKLTDAHWYRMKALRATLLMGRGEWEQAGHLLIDAKRHQPETERAKVNEAMGYELLGDRVRAHSLATALRKEYPRVVRPAAIWIRTAPDSLPFSDLEAVAAALPSNEEIHLALAHRGMVAALPGKTVAAAQLVIECAPNAPQGHFQLALALHMQASAETRPAERAQLLHAAEASYDRVIDLCREQRLLDVEAAALVNRGILRTLLADPRAEADFVAAADRGSKNRDFRFHYAGYLFNEERFADAVRELERVSQRDGPEVRWLEASARYGRNESGHRCRAKKLLVSIIAAGPGPRWVEAHMLLVQWATQEQDPAPAEVAIRASQLAIKNPLVFHALLGWLANVSEDPEAADRELDTAVAGLREDSPRNEVRLLAQLFLLRGKDGMALPLLERCAKPGVLDTDGRRLLDCAIRVNRHDVVMRVCRELRLAGVPDPRILRTELHVLNMYDAGEALRVAGEYLARNPDDKHVTLWQSHLAIRLERPDLVVVDVARLPPPSEVDPWMGQMVMNVLRERRKFSAALHYSYELLREHFEDEDAHGQYLMYFHTLAPRVPEVNVESPVTVGMAVCYSEADDSPEHWVVIEPGADPDVARNEYPPEHHICRILVGRKAGDTVVLSVGAVQDRTATVRAVTHRYVYRYQTCMNQFQVLFPDSSICQLVRVVSGNEFDPTPMVKSLQGRRQHVEWLDELYRTQPLPFHTYAAWGGADEFAAWEHLTSSPRLGIHCCSGRREELRDAMELARSCKTIVLDSTALNTLARLKLLNVLACKHWTFVVSQGTYDHFRDVVDGHECEPGEQSSMQLGGDDRLVLIESSAEQRAQRLAFLRSIPDAVRAHCRISPCPEAAALTPGKRAQLSEVIGRRNLETMLLATGGETALWSDDHMLYLIAQADFKVPRVWTLVMLQEATMHGALTQSDFARAAAKLVGWHYGATHMDSMVLVAAAELTEWDMSRWPMPLVVQPLGNPEIPAVTRLSMAAEAIKAVWQRDELGAARQGFLFAVLAGIRSVSLIRRLLRHIPALFGVDVFGADAVETYIRYWLRYPTVVVTR